MSYLQSAIEYADKWLEFDPTKSRYSIKKNIESENPEIDVKMGNVTSIDTNSILPDKDKSNFITQINSRFMNLP